MNTKQNYVATVAFDSAPHTREVTKLQYEACNKAEVKKWAVREMSQYFQNVKVLNVEKVRP